MHSTDFMLPRFMRLLAGAAMGAALLGIAACSSDPGMEGSSYEDGEYGSLRLRSAAQAPIRGVQGITVECDVKPQGSSEQAIRQGEMLGYCATLTQADGKPVRFIANYGDQDSLSTMLLMEEPWAGLSETHRRFFIPNCNLHLPPGSHALKLRVEARRLRVDSTRYVLSGSPDDLFFAGEVPLQVVQPQLHVHTICSVFFAVNDAVVDPYSFDWPSARPDLFWKVARRCEEELLGNWSVASTIHWRSTEWVDTAECLRLVLAEGDSVHFAVYDYDRLDANDYLGSFHVNIGAVANRGLTPLPNFGQVKDLMVDWRKENYVVR